MPTIRQELGLLGELKVVRTCTCPKCKRRGTLVRLPANFKCADIICDFCGYLAQVKASTVKDIGTIPKRVLGAAWGPQKERMDAAIYFPLFLVLVSKASKSSAIYYLSVAEPKVIQKTGTLESGCPPCGLARLCVRDEARSE